MVLPNLVVVGVDDAVAVAVGTVIFVDFHSQRVAPDGVVGGVDGQIEVVVAGEVGSGDEFLHFEGADVHRKAFGRVAVADAIEARAALVVERNALA